MKLIITGQLQQKINYLLKRFDIEWSGPAWFTYEKSDKGFPTIWKLKHFLPLDLGSHSETEWDANDFMKKARKLYKRFPELKQMFQGNIHSHHTMGAFFSSTDKQLLDDAANNVGYPSLVVANEGKKTHAFAMSYLDQYKQPHIYESKEIEIEYDLTIEKDWIQEADTIEKKAESNPKNGYYSYKNNRNNQMAIYSHIPQTSLVQDYGSIGTIDHDVVNELNRCKTPKERFEMALNVFETGFMDEDALKREQERYASTAGQHQANKLKDETLGDDNDEFDSWNESFNIGQG